MALPLALIKFNAKGLEGIRMATVWLLAVTIEGTAGCFFNTMVKGPGQK